MNEAIIGVLGTVLGALFGFSSYRRYVKRDGAEQGRDRTDIEYIKRRTDDILLEQKNTNMTLSSHAERITRVEESVKQAHKRIDSVSGGALGTHEF